MSDAGEKRAKARAAFLDSSGWGGATVEALPGDASFRHYFRLQEGSSRALLMDAPPEAEDVRPYVKVAEHLLSLGLSAPKILARDEQEGFLVIEDFGEATFTRLLAAGEDQRPLYELAVDVLAALHDHPRNASLELPPYDLAALQKEAALLTDWYLPALTGAPTGAAVRAAYLEAWRQVFEGLPGLPKVLVLRDYHVDNLMLLKDRKGPAACGLLDFQDALIGNPAYDLISLLEDARRDVPEDLAGRLFLRYLERRGGALDGHLLGRWCACLGAQRHAKVAGIFVRLMWRDGKPVYLKHIPRVVRMLERQIRSAPDLQPLADWCKEHLPDFSGELPVPESWGPKPQV
jgi:aminoglycoside/choline kinase family phosphotransferase